MLSKKELKSLDFSRKSVLYCIILKYRWSEWYFPIFKNVLTKDQDTFMLFSVLINLFTILVLYFCLESAIKLVKRFWRMFNLLANSEFVFLSQQFLKNLFLPPRARWGMKLLNIFWIILSLKQIFSSVFKF